MSADLSERIPERILVMESPQNHMDYVSYGLKRLVDDLSASACNESYGLDHVVCGTSRLAGFSEERVEYCGIDVEDLTDGVPFEAVVWLLLTGELPSDEQLADVSAVLRESAFVEQSATDALCGLPLRTRPLELLPLAVSVLSFYDPTQMDRSPAATRSRVWRLFAQLPVLLGGSLDGLSSNHGQPSSDGRPMLAEAILNLVKGTRGNSNATSSLEENVMNTVLICQCMTELRPACFAARFFGSTVGDVIPSLRSAASLYVAQMRNDPYEWIGSRLRSFESPDQAEDWLSERHDQLIPYGFTIDGTDPRAFILKQSSHRLLGCPDRICVAACADRLETLMRQRGRYPTMDWGAVVALTLLDIPPERMSLVIALARIVGWAAQAIDQNASGISLLPQLHYAL